MSLRIGQLWLTARQGVRMPASFAGSATMSIARIRPWPTVQHRGRRSGRAYAIPVAVRPSTDASTIALPWGTETQWLRNVLAAGGCTLRWRGGDHLATDPRVIGAAEAADAFSPIQRALLRAVGVRSFLRLRRADVSLRDREPRSP
jgi:deazaflavin-dependent oxidoreductase (nitroreductase family)